MSVGLHTYAHEGVCVWEGAVGLWERVCRSARAHSAGLRV